MYERLGGVYCSETPKTENFRSKILDWWCYLYRYGKRTLPCPILRRYIRENPCSRHVENSILLRVFFLATLRLFAFLSAHLHAHLCVPPFLLSRSFTPQPPRRLVRAGIRGEYASEGWIAPEDDEAPESKPAAGGQKGNNTNISSTMIPNGINIRRPVTIASASHSLRRV